MRNISSDFFSGGHAKSSPRPTLNFIRRLKYYLTTAGNRPDVRSKSAGLYLILFADVHRSLSQSGPSPLLPD